jgi:predicted dehydrogenase
MSSVRIALLGAGLIGREHMRLIATSNSAVLAAIVDPDPGARAEAERVGVPWYDRHEAMLDASRPDGVIVALPNQLHVPAALACVERRIPVLVEKPIADTLASAMELVAAAEKAGVPVLAGHQRRHSPDIVEARRAVRDGDIGRLIAINGIWLVRKHESYFEAAWRRRKGGGPLLINLIHDIDCFRFICGEIESVQAITSNRERGFAVEDTAAVLMRFENGALGTFLLSDAVPSPYMWDTASGQALYFPHQPEDCYVIGGSKASLAVPSMDLWQPARPNGDWRDPNVRRRLQATRSSCYANQLENFVGVIRGSAQPHVTAREGMMSLAAILAIERAADQGRPVRLAEMLDQRLPGASGAK